MAEKGTRGASGQWDEKLHKDFNTPLSLLLADPSQDRFVGFNEFGDKIYKTLGGKEYTIGAVKPATSIPETVESLANAVPPMKDWRLPTSQETVDIAKNLAKGVAQGVVDFVKTPTNPDATLGDLFGFVGGMAAPGLRAAFSSPDLSRTNIFFSAPKEVAEQAKKLEAEGASRQEIAQQLGVWKDPQDRWLAEIDDLDAEIRPEYEETSRKWGGSRGEMGDAIYHPELFEKFPELKTRNFRLYQPYAMKKIFNSDADGIYFTDNGEIAVSDTPNAKETLLHELQHAVDHIEGRDHGASSQKVWSDITAIYEDLPSDSKEALSLLQMQKLLSNDLNRHKSYLKSQEKQPDEKLITWTDGTQETLGDFRNRMAETAEMRENLGYEINALRKSASQDFKVAEDLFSIAQSKVFNDGEAFDTYYRNEGEKRARVTADRADLSSQGRRGFDPFQDKTPTWSQDQLTKAINRARNHIDTSQGIVSYEDELMNLPMGEYAEGGMVSMTPNENPVPPGATTKEVADDVDIKASEGEYIIPANVVRFLGLDKIEKMINKAKEQLAQLDEQGRIGGKTDDDLPFSMEELQAVEDAPVEDTPKMAAGGLVAAPNPTGQLPYWMQQSSWLNRGTANESPMAGAQNENLVQANESTDPKYKPPTGLAGSVDKWTPKDFEKYSVARNSPEQKFGQYMASLAPLGGTMAKFRERYLERNVPKELQNMISSKKDLQGNPLDEDQIQRLQGVYDNITKTPLDGFGRAGLVRQIGEDVGLVKPRSPEKIQKQQDNTQKDSFLNRVLDAVTQSPSRKKEDTKKDDPNSDRSKDTPSRSTSSRSRNNKR